MANVTLEGQHTFPNGWTVSIIGHGYGSSEGLLEGWAWHEDGRTDEDVRGWLTRDEAAGYIAEVAQRTD